MGMSPTRMQRVLRQHFRRTLISGLLLLFPLALTFIIVRFLFDFADGVLRPGIQWVIEQFGIDWTLPGAGLAAAVILIYVLGLLATLKLGRRVGDRVRDTVLRIPFVGSIYSANRQLVESFSGSGAKGFKRVVLAQFPKENTWSIGFLTGITDPDGLRKLVMVYVPTAPLPNSGFVVFVPPEDVVDTDLSVADAMQLIFSGGIVSPTSIKTKRIDIAELERQIDQLNLPADAMAATVKGRVLATVSVKGRTSRFSINRLRIASASGIKAAQEAGHHSGSIARDAMVGTIQAVRELGDESIDRFRDTMIGVVHGARDATGVTTKLIHDAVAGAIHGSQDSGKQDAVARGAAEGAIHVAPSIGVTSDQAITQVSQGIMEGLQQSETELVRGTEGAFKGVIAGVFATKGNPFEAAHRCAYEMIASAAKVDGNLEVIGRVVIKSAIEVGQELSLDSVELAAKAEAGAKAAAFEVSETAGNLVTSAVAGTTTEQGC
jgi:uncharacterized membrane protein